MEIIICPTRDAAVRTTAHMIETRLLKKASLVLGLATGRTMEDVYAHLASSKASFAKCTTFNLDEYIGLHPDDPNSYRWYMNEHLFKHVDINPANTHLPDGMAEDLQKAALDYEDKIKQAGGIDLQLLGIGETGHIGFNEPLSALMSRTRDKTLTRITREQNAVMFGGDLMKVPTRSMTMGVGTILEAREVLLLACGSHKAKILAKAIEGPITASISASALQFHPNCKIILDDDAAAELEGREYYDFILDEEAHPAL